MIANTKRRGKPAGTVGDSITFVLTRELRGKTKETIVAIISNAVV